MIYPIKPEILRKFMFIDKEVFKIYVYGEPEGYELTHFVCEADLGSLLSNKAKWKAIYTVFTTEGNQEVWLIFDQITGEIENV